MAKPPEKLTRGGRDDQIEINGITIKADWQHEYVQHYLDPVDDKGLQSDADWKVTVSGQDYMRIGLTDGQYVPIHAGGEQGHYYFRGRLDPRAGGVTLKFNSDPPHPITGR
jgi:hypothetical protein